MWRSRGGRSETSRSPMRTVPPSIRSRPARHRSSVVLPQPDGPSRTMNSPSRMSRSTSFSATVFPKVLRTDSKATLAISSAPRSPQVEEIAAHEEDEEERRDDEEEAAGESEVERRDVERAEHLSRKRRVADREDRRGEDLVPRGHEGEDRGGREAGQGQGSATRTNAPKRDVPSVVAASSSSRETPRNTPAVTMTMNGRTIAVWMMITPCSVSYRPIWMNVTARGIDRIAIGNIFEMSTPTWIKPRPGKLNRASA